VDFLDERWMERDRFRIVRNGVDCDVFKPGPPRGNNMIGIGRISPEKGYDDLAAAVRSLRKRYPDFKCMVAGSGPTEAQDGVEFAGPVANVAEFLRNGIIYVSTSRVEGMSNALLEAQAAGLPAVTRRIGGNSEVVRDGVTGFLCGDVDEFVRCIELLYTTPALRERMGAEARKLMLSEFSIAAQVNKLEAVYDELL
jgi:glycosyltransferase involved in cell wall biosynthesis